MEKTLIIFSHPALEKSRANRALIEMASVLDGVTVNDLYEEYPDFQIDVRREKELILSHQRIVWQHPFYWYSTPALMKEWFDMVLEYGWAYGKGGEALRGKRVRSVITTGGSEEAYGRQGYNRYTIDEFLRPQEQTANLCGMTFLKPLVFFDALHLGGEAMGAALERYRSLLLSDD
jgi:glutathione-regulated potassium-efflux system ancillary protein KefG